jgi:hypothetical protein
MVARTCDGGYRIPIQAASAVALCGPLRGATRGYGREPHQYAAPPYSQGERILQSLRGP